MYKFIKSTLEDNRRYLSEYLKKLPADIDSFQEEHILKSKVYSVLVNDEHKGYFAYCENVFDIQGFTVLTQFIIDPKSLRHAKGIFKKLLEEFDIKSAFVLSADEEFLSVAMDFHKSVSKQAYMHVDGTAPVREPEFSKNCLVLAGEEDFSWIQSMTNNYFDFLEAPEKVGKYQLYILKNEGTVLGFGLLEDGQIMKNTKSLGNYTMAEHRQKGVGRSIMMHLRDICYEQGYKPLTGCYYYNEKSKYTLDSAGFVSRTRLFRIEFTEDKKWVEI